MPQVTSSSAPRAGQATSSEIAAPSTRSDLEAISQLRSELRDQLSSLNSRRIELIAQQRVAGERGAAEVAPRIASLDQQIAQVERQLAEADRAVSAGIGRGLGRTPRVEIPRGVSVTVPPFFPRTYSVTPILIANAASVVLMAVLFWAIVRHRLRGPAAAPALADQSRRLDQLQQAVDTMAVEIERISEGQRYVTKMLGERLPPASLPATTDRSS